MTTVVLDKEKRDAHFSADAETALAILNGLLTPVEDKRTGQATARLPKSVLRHSQALGFVVQRKAGLGLGFSHGAGFVVSRTGPESWSAPSFFTVNDVSVGLTLGYEKLETLLALPTQAAALKLAAGDFRVGADFAFEIGEAGELFTAPSPGVDSFGNPVPQGVLPEVVNKSHEEVWGAHAAATDRAVAYSLSDSFIADISIKAGLLQEDTTTNKGLFGERATPALLLSGDILAPPQFDQLFVALNKATAEAGGGGKDHSA